MNENVLPYIVLSAFKLFHWWSMVLHCTTSLGNWNDIPGIRFHLAFQNKFCNCNYKPCISICEFILRPLR